MSDNAKPVRVLFVVDSTFPGAGGAEAQARKLAKALTAKGAVLEYVAPRTHDFQTVNEVLDGLPLHRIKYPLVKFFGAIVLLVHFAWYLYKRRNDFDVIHVHITRLLASVAVAMSAITGVPVIAKISGYFEFKGGVLDSEAINPANALLRRTLRRIDYVQTISGQTREKLIEAGFKDEQILFIPNGVDTAEAAPITNDSIEQEMNSSDTLVFGYCGRLREIKGVHILIDAFEALTKTAPKSSVRLRIAGDGDCYDKLSKRVADAGLGDHIEFLGNIADTEEFYRSLDVYVQPSFAEGLPNAVIEAMVSRLPIIATDIGGNSDLVTHEKEGWLFEAGDVQALTALMRQCVEQRNSLAEVGSEARTRIVENYDINAVADDLLAVYRG